MNHHLFLGWNLTEFESAFPPATPSRYSRLLPFLSERDAGGQRCESRRNRQQMLRYKPVEWSSDGDCVKLTDWLSTGEKEMRASPPGSREWNNAWRSAHARAHVTGRERESIEKDEKRKRLRFLPPVTNQRSDWDLCKWGMMSSHRPPRVLSFYRSLRAISLFFSSAPDPNASPCPPRPRSRRFFTLSLVHTRDTHTHTHTYRAWWFTSVTKT